MALHAVVNGTRSRILLIALSVLFVSLSHFLVPTHPHTYHMVHIVLRKLYFLPPVLAGAWFGLRGSVFTTVVITAVFSAHAIVDWPGDYVEQANQLGELAGFWVVGVVPGYLFDRQRSLLKSLAQAHEQTLLVLVAALDMREKNTRLHSQRVRDYTLLLAERYGVPEKERETIAFGALLHDVGKISISDNILLKPSGLSELEWQEMRRHPLEGYKALARVDFLHDAAEIVYAHHEHYDGTGYPRGLRGEEIPLGARLFMVADVLDALTSKRPYRQAASFSEASSEIIGKSGSHFDPSVVQVFQNMNAADFQKVSDRYKAAE